MPKIKLKPCPFCGGKAQMCAAQWDFKKNCPANSAGYIVECGECLASTDAFATMELTADAWNRRADNDT